MELMGMVVLTLLASMVGTLTGFGTSTIMMPVVSLFLPFTQTLFFVGIIHWFSNVWKMVFFRKGFDLKLILWFGIPGAAISFLAARLPVMVSQTSLERYLGIFLIGYVLFVFFRPKWRIGASDGNALTGGVLSGFFAGVFGVGGAIRSVFLAAFNLKKEIFLFTSGAIGMGIDSARMFQYWFSGIRLSEGLLMTAIICIPVSLLGGFIGKKLVDRVPQKSFRLLIAGALLLVGLRYLW